MFLTLFYLLSKFLALLLPVLFCPHHFLFFRFWSLLFFQFFFHFGLSNKFRLIRIDYSFRLSIKFVSFLLEHFFTNRKMFFQRFLCKLSSASLSTCKQFFINLHRIFNRSLFNTRCYGQSFINIDNFLFFNSVSFS